MDSRNNLTDLADPTVTKNPFYRAKKPILCIKMGFFISFDGLLFPLFFHILSSKFLDKFSTLMYTVSILKAICSRVYLQRSILQLTHYNFGKDKKFRSLLYRLAGIPSVYPLHSEKVRKRAFLLSPHFAGIV